MFYRLVPGNMFMDVLGVPRPGSLFAYDLILKDNGFDLWFQLLPLTIGIPFYDILTGEQTDSVPYLKQAVIEVVMAFCMRIEDQDRSFHIPNLLPLERMDPWHGIGPGC